MFQISASSPERPAFSISFVRQSHGSSLNNSLSSAYDLFFLQQHVPAFSVHIRVYQLHRKLSASTMSLVSSIYTLN